MDQPVLMILLFLLFLCSYLVMHLWIRVKFIAEGYRASGSYPKKRTKYRAEWSPLERLFLKPLFSARSTGRYRALAVVNTVHLFMIVLWSVFFVLSEALQLDLHPEYISIGIVAALFLTIFIGTSGKQQ